MAWLGKYKSAIHKKNGENRIFYGSNYSTYASLLLQVDDHENHDMSGIDYYMKKNDIEHVEILDRCT